MRTFEVRHPAQVPVFVLAWLLIVKERWSFCPIGRTAGCVPCISSLARNSLTHALTTRSRSLNCENHSLSNITYHPSPHCSSPSTQNASATTTTTTLVHHYRLPHATCTHYTPNLIRAPTLPYTPVSAMMMGVVCHGRGAALALDTLSHLTQQHTATHTRAHTHTHTHTHTQSLCLALARPSVQIMGVVCHGSSTSMHTHTHISTLPHAYLSVSFSHVRQCDDDGGNDRGCPDA
jgi:hypothetical protein